MAGGRELHLRSLQSQALHLANSLFLGDYLHTPVADRQPELGGSPRRRRDRGRTQRMTALAGPGVPLVARNHRLVWHPDAALDGPAPYAVLAADGVRLQLEAPSGEPFEPIDAMSSRWCAIHGYRRPMLDATLREQASRFSHLMFGGLAHEPTAALAEQPVTGCGLASEAPQ